MDIKEKKDILKTLMRLSFIYSRYGNIPRFGAVGLVMMLLIIAVVEWFWFSYGGHPFVGVLIFFLILTVHCVVSAITRPSVVEEIQRLLVRYPAVQQAEYYSLLHDIDIGLPAAFSRNVDRVLVHSWGEKLFTWVKNENYLLGQATGKGKFGMQANEAHAETSQTLLENTHRMVVAFRKPVSGQRETRGQSDE
ncbi:hypothetical protein QO199_25335 [Serratia bockelmannii]|uniref:Uncharacterized protein n=2 Tax=Serratia bockelmannii TaxID=2703793 RepID=A0ABT8LZA5_9GAMM|nr:hypothetical protein [Serratia bockelmannii]HBH6890274.1 hypothetical protein [Serratia marcescens]